MAVMKVLQLLDRDQLKAAELYELAKSINKNSCQTLSVSWQP